MSKTETTKVALWIARTPGLARRVKPTKDGLKISILEKKVADDHHQRWPRAPRRANAADIELLLRNYFPSVELGAAILILLERYALLRLDQFRRAGDQLGIAAANTLLEKVIRLTTKRKSGESVGAAISVDPNISVVHLLLHKIEGEKRLTAKELQRLSGTKIKDLSQFRRLLRTLGIRYKKDKRGPEKGTKYQPRH